LVSERLTSSPRIVDTYGLCGIASLSEYAAYGGITRDVYGVRQGRYRRDKDGYFLFPDWRPLNKLSPVEKLKYALNMAEAVADLHGFSDGVIIHDDLKVSQFLWGPDGSSIKLNDFNRAIFRMWDDNKQQYCAWDESETRKNRSPEEYNGSHNLTEAVDVYNMDWIFYSLLAGRSKMDEEKTARVTKKGGKLKIDERYRHTNVADAKLVELIDRCTEYDPDDRPSIFEVVEELKEALRTAIADEYTIH